MVTNHSPITRSASLGCYSSFVIRHFLILLCTLPVFAADAPAPAPLPKPPEPLYETRAEHDPNGIGKFFMGREIAHVMGHQAWKWLERPEREQEERTDLLLAALALKPGMIVADIGAGSGYFTWRMAEKIAPAGKVMAVEIQQEMLDLINRNMARRGITNFQPVLGETTDPKLPAASVDLMLLVDVYHEFDFPYEMTQAMVRALKPGGRLVLVEFRGEDPAVPIKLVHKMTEAQVKKEMAVHPLDFVQNIATLPQQHILIFKKQDGAACCDQPVNKAALMLKAGEKK